MDNTQLISALNHGMYCKHCAQLAYYYTKTDCGMYYTFSFKCSVCDKHTFVRVTKYQNNKVKRYAVKR